jgi:hypothetical protein
MIRKVGTPEKIKKVRTGSKKEISSLRKEIALEQSLEQCYVCSRLIQKNIKCACQTK